MAEKMNPARGKWMKEVFSLIIDQGTHATRAMAVDRQGRMRLSAFAPISLFRLSDIHVEQNGEEILASVERVVRQVLSEALTQQLDLICAGLATQRSSVVAWDLETGKPLSPVISWQDRRVCRWLARFRDSGSVVQGLSGLPLSPHYGAGKLRYLFDNLPLVRVACEGGTLAWGPLASFLLFHLLRERPYLIDHANAQRTQLWNLQTRSWDTTLMTLFQLPPALLPACRPVCSQYGRLKAADIPMTAVSGDQNAAFFSLGNPSAGAARVNLGTGGFILLSTGAKPVFHPSLLSGIATSSEKSVQYLLEGTVNGAGAAFEWAADTWRISDFHRNLPDWLSREMAVPVFINAVGGLGSPWWRSEAISYLVGEGSARQRAVAVAESILFLVQENLNTMNGCGCDIEQLTITGGLARLDGLCRRLADLSGKPVYRPAEIEATVRGAAWLAFDRPRYWPKPGRGRWFRPASNDALIDRYRLFCREMAEKMPRELPQ
jgi:glycerol kinase